MEERKNTLKSLRHCRFCLTQDDGFLQSLYEKTNKPFNRNTITLPLKILSCISVEVFPSDNMPTYICQKCRYFIDLMYIFKQHICRRTDETILNYIQNGSDLEPTVWPPLLNKIYKNTTKQPNEKRGGTIKTVVEGGATVQVSTQDSESDGDESVYDVKIEDGDDSSSCINVIASKNTSDNKLKLKKVFTDNQDTEVENPIADGCWACDECDCTYPLQQLLELHKIKKHRERTAACDKCDAKFFSKYDLESHKLCHSNETPFRCIACGKRFKRLSLLKRHEKMIHSDLLQLKCEACPATFISAEELEIHQKRHPGSGPRPFVCDLCNKRFTVKNALDRHVAAVHTPKAELSCEYCPERFSTVPKLAKHVRTHAGSRSYPCKYCDKSFLKSHHYTRHIRLRHREESGLGSIEQYRCEQCEDTFTTQDELIYHSAIHATQNLTCPLCQEHFEDVDAVTAHIKSHVNGTEFQCDYCELVFTSKEKLKKHAFAEHEEEMQDDKLANEDSMETDDYDSINLKEEDDHMVVEIKKADSFLLPNPMSEVKDEEKTFASLSEGSESDSMFTELTTPKTVGTPTVTHKNDVPMLEVQPLVSKVAGTVAATPPPAHPKPPVQAVQAQHFVNDSQTPSILKKAEEAKKKIHNADMEKKPKPNTKSDNVTTSASSTGAAVTSASSSGTNGTSTNNSTGGGTTDKSLRLLEKELQELKRTTVRNDTNKISVKPTETPKRRPPPHASTPKLRSTDDKKSQVSLRSSNINIEKKVPERRAVKENKEPKETKANVISKEEKEKANSGKEEKETKENDTPKNSVKSGALEKVMTPEEGVRRSTRPSKVKDYAKMIRTQVYSGDDDDSSDDDEEYVEPEKAAETRSSRGRRQNASKSAAVKPPPPAKSTPSPANPRKRGRPRKDQLAHTSAKVMKDDPEKEEESKDETAASTEQEDRSKVAPETAESQEQSSTQETKNTETNLSGNSAADKNSIDDNVASDGRKTPTSEQKPASNLIVSPSGQTLKKVPIKALPPGVKPLPLPTTARAMAPGETCEMQIGKKVVKVQKIVMTKAEVEAMAKKGLLEMKDGTMVLKPGIKLHSAAESPPAAKPVADAEGTSKESQIRSDKPTRCELDEEAAA